MTLAEDTTFQMYCGEDGVVRSARWELVVADMIPEDPVPIPMYAVETPGTVVDTGVVEVDGDGPWSTTVTIPADVAPGRGLFARGDCLDEEGEVLFGYHFLAGTIVDGSAVAPATTVAPPATPAPAGGADPAVAADAVVGSADYTG